MKNDFPPEEHVSFSAARDQKDFLMKPELRLIVTVDTHRAKKRITNDTRRRRELDYAENFPFFRCTNQIESSTSDEFHEQRCAFISQTRVLHNWIRLIQRNLSW